MPSAKQMDEWRRRVAAGRRKSDRLYEAEKQRTWDRLKYVPSTAVDWVTGQTTFATNSYEADIAKELAKQMQVDIDNQVISAITAMSSAAEIQTKVEEATHTLYNYDNVETARKTLLNKIKNSMD